MRIILAENQSREFVIGAARIADEAKAGEIAALDVGGHCNFADYFLIATCATRPQMRAVSNKIQEYAKERGRHSVGVEGHGADSWTLVDFGDVIVHLFNADARAYYNLERLWGDSTQVEWRVNEAAGAGSR